jgi:hypothetical protein
MPTSNMAINTLFVEDEMIGRAIGTGKAQEKQHKKLGLGIRLSANSIRTCAYLHVTRGPGLPALLNDSCLVPLIGPHHTRTSE